jgi:hypothetical protein
MDMMNKILELVVFSQDSKAESTTAESVIRPKQLVRTGNRKWELGGSKTRKSENTKPKMGI